MALGALDDEGLSGYGASADAPMSGMPEDDAPAEYDSEETAALAEAFPELAKDPARLDALQVAIKMCVDRALDRGGESGRPSSPPIAGKGGKAKAPPALVLAFGKGPKSKEE